MTAYVRLCRRPTVSISVSIGSTSKPSPASCSGSPPRHPSPVLCFSLRRCCSTSPPPTPPLPTTLRGRSAPYDRRGERGARRGHPVESPTVAVRASLGRARPPSGAGRLRRRDRQRGRRQASRPAPRASPSARTSQAPPTRSADRRDRCCRHQWSVRRSKLGPGRGGSGPGGGSPRKRVTGLLGQRRHAPIAGIRADRLKTRSGSRVPTRRTL